MQIRRISLFLMVGIFSSTLSMAQVDLKVNPIGLLFSHAAASAEIGINDNVGVELTGGYAYNHLTFDNVKFQASTPRFGGNARYYFNPHDGADGFYAGIYSRYAAGKWTSSESTDKVTSSRLASGFLFGFKTVSDKNILFDFGLGFGRAFIHKYKYDSGQAINLSKVPFINFDIPIYLSIGYRLGGDGGSSKSRRK